MEETNQQKTEEDLTGPDHLSVIFIVLDGFFDIWRQSLMVISIPK